MNTRSDIDLILKNDLVPFLRVSGFKGTLPHFHRKSKNRINLLSFQRQQAVGTQFIIEISKAPLDGITTH